MLTQVLPESRTKYALPRIKEVFLTGKSREIEEELVVEDIPHQVIQQIIPFATGVLIVVKDVTESHHAQVALRDSQEYLSSVIANAPIIIYELDCEGHFKLSAGRSLEQIGLAAGEAVGQSIFDFFTLDSPEVIAFEQAVKGETVTTQTQLGDGYFTSRYTPRFDEKQSLQLGLAAGEYVKVSVIDNGCGIPEEAQKMIFEPFFSTKEAGKGSGLGLSMVYGFVDQSGGAIALTSEVGVGSQFHLYLPRSTKEATS